MFCITKWCKCITDSGKDEYTGKGQKLKEATKGDPLYKFRLLDDDGEVYAYGLSTSCDDENAFDPLDRYECDYGCTMIEYKNSVTGEWEQL